MTRLRMTLPFVSVLLLGASLPAILQARPSSSVQTISVTAGAPHELSFKLSSSKIATSTVVFKVTNKGKLAHSFKVCTRPSTNDRANSCTGVSTKSLAPGTTAVLTVKLSASGTYEYLSGTPSQAKSGMKGVVTVTVATTAKSGPKPVGTTTTTPSSSGSGSGSGGVVNGQATDPACSPGTAIPVGAGAGDQDEDNEGGFPTDGDGCL